MFGLRSATHHRLFAKRTNNSWLAGALCSTVIIIGGCCNCAELESPDNWNTSILGGANATTRDEPALASPSAPDCSVKGAKTPSETSGAPEAYADRNLLEIARLELERDCYKAAEKNARRNLKSQQQSRKKVD
jgi:hypothetical protein